MKIFLDDERKPYHDYMLMACPQEVIRELAARNYTGVGNKTPVEYLSLDHDLGDNMGNGNDVLLWVEEQVHTREDFICPHLKIHTANPPARHKMILGAEQIQATLQTFGTDIDVSTVIWNADGTVQQEF